MDQLRALKYFCQVVESGSFTKAAEIFSVPPSSLSRRIADLEKALGATLLKRSTRVVEVTEIGQLYFQQVQEILFQLEESNETVRSYHAKPTGQLSISSLTGFGEELLLPLLDEFKVLYPEIILNVYFTDELSVLGRDNVDIAIRGGYAPNERVQAIRLMDNEFIPVASPGYIEKYGLPKTALELRNHRGLFYQTPNGPTPWLSKVDGEWVDVSGEKVSVSNNRKWLARQVESGQGIMLAPRWNLGGLLESGQLVELHLDPPVCVTQSPDLAIYLLYQKQRYLVPKVKVAVEFFVDRIQKIGER